MTYKSALGQRRVLDSASLWAARHLVYTIAGFMLLRDDNDTIYRVDRSGTLDGGSRDDSPRKEITRSALRGDANNDGRVDHADAETILECLISRGACFDCEAASDANADGRVDFQDAMYLLSWLYADGPPPPVPGPYRCGEIDLDDPDSCGETYCETLTARDGFRYLAWC